MKFYFCKDKDGLLLISPEKPINKGFYWITSNPQNRILVTQDLGDYLFPDLFFDNSPIIIDYDNILDIFGDNYKIIQQPNGHYSIGYGETQEIYYKDKITKEKIFVGTVFLSSKRASLGKDFAETIKLKI